MLVLTLAVAAQDRAQLRRNPAFEGLPGEVEHLIKALGRRTQHGQEQTLLQGTYQDRHGSERAIRVTLQLPDFVRIDGFHRDLPLIFSYGDPRLSSLEEKRLLDIFAFDTAEAMLSMVRKGAALYVAGQRFGPEISAGSSSTYGGPYYDVYELTAPAESRELAEEPVRRYFFNSDTGLLASTQYWDARRGVHVETRLSHWQQSMGSAYPGVVEAFENGERTSTFTFARFETRARREQTSQPVSGETFSR
jgi:hypothetical protein